MMNTDKLKKAGIDYEKGLYRFMGDVALYNMVLRDFLEDESFGLAENALRRRDYGELFERVHSVKGLSGNLDMVELYRVSGELSDLTRGGVEPEGEQAVEEAFSRMKAAYISICEGIASAMEG